MEMGNLAIYNANILTLSSAKPHADAAVIRDGHITAVGMWQDIAADAGDAPAMDLACKTVLPGFIDSHVHFTWTGMRELALDFYPAGTVDDIKRMVRQAALETPPGNLIFGMGLNHYHFPDSKLPHSDELDAVAPDHPVFIVGVTGHYALANRLCRAELNLAAETRGLGADGLLRDSANSIAGQKMRRRYAQEQGLERLHQAAAQQAVAAGLTTVHALEGTDQENDPAVLALLEISQELPLRLVLWYQTMNERAVRDLGLNRIGGCILLDGDFGPHTAALLTPYADQPDNRGTLYHTQEEIDGFVERAHRAGLQIAMHAVGDRAVEQALNAYARALNNWPRSDARHRIEHFEIYDKTLAERARQLGIHIAIQPPFNIYFGGHNRLDPILGKERALRSDPVRSLIEAGLNVGGGSDSFVTPMKPLYGVHCAVNHSNPHERIAVERALKLYTSDNARMAFEEKIKGSIEVGKLGDLVVLDADPTVVPSNAIKDIAVAMTVLGGQIVYKRNGSNLEAKQD